MAPKPLSKPLSNDRPVLHRPFPFRMDIQAILDASDSSDDGVDLPAYRLSEDTTSKDLLVEQILREQDDDEGADDFDVNEYDRSYGGYDDAEDDDEYLGSDVMAQERSIGGARRSHGRPDSWGGASLRSKIWSTKSLYPANAARVFSTYDPSTETSVRSHNPEDWAVLQAILQESDDDDDEVSDGVDWRTSTNEYSSSGPSSISKSMQQQEQEHFMDPISVDEILQDDEMDGSDENLLNVRDGANRQLKECTVPAAVPTGILSMLVATTSQATSKLLDSDDQMAVNGTKTNGSPHSRSSPSNATDRCGTSKYSQNSTPATKLPAHNGFSARKRLPLSQSVEQLDEEASKKAMSQARAYERKLLKSGQREIVSPLMVKRRLKPRIEMGPRGKARKKQTAAERLSASANPRFGFSGSVENRPVADVSRSIWTHVQTDAKVHTGLPTCLAFNSKFIAVGTQLGYILMYDLFEVLRQRLSAANHDDAALRRAGSITSIDLSANGEAIIAGYVSGILLLWDTIKGVVLRSVTDTHPSPITSVRFLTELKIVSVDAGGLVNKLAFARTILWSNYSVEIDCLLDGTAGQILAMNVLPSFSTVNPLVRPDAYAMGLKNLTLIALSSERSSFVVAVDPTVHVLHRWSRPLPEKVQPAVVSTAEGGGHGTYLPCLAWGWALTSGGGNVVMPILARTWGCCLQLLCASFPSVEDAVPPPGTKQQIHWPAFGVYEEIDTSTPVVALEWLNDRSLVYLTATNELTVVDSVMLTMLERLDFSTLKLVYAEFSLSRSSDGGNASSCITFQNSVRCSDDRVMVLCREELRCVSIVTARRRITSLEEDGEWLEALALALDYFENTVLSQEDKRRDHTGRRDFSRHPEFAGAKSEDEEWIAKLLSRYIALAIDNAPEAVGEYGWSPDRNQSKIDLAQSHFQMLAGVCVEFCVVTRRLDLLFGTIFRRFEAVGYASVFLDVMQPYLLSEKLNYIAPEVMAYFIEHCKATNGMNTVERCLLHMDVRIMDFDNILSLLRANEMYSALFYVFNEGLADYLSPLELLFDRVFDEADKGSAALSRSRDGTLQTAFQRLGYKAILYIETCFQGKTFPQEKELLPEERKVKVKRELLSFLTQEDFRPCHHSKRHREGAPLVGQRSLLYPYMRLLLLVDPRETLSAVSIALDNAATEPGRQRLVSENWSNESARVVMDVPDIQEVMNVLETIVLPTPGGLDVLALESPGLVNAFLDFTARYLMASTAIQVNKEITFMIIRRMSDRFVHAKDSNDKDVAQRRVLELLSALPRDSYEPDAALSLIGKAGIYRAALLLHQQVASSWHEDKSRDIDRRSRHFRCAIDCYLDDNDESFRREVFDYIKKECAGVADRGEAGQISNSPSLRDAVFEKLPALVHLDPLMTARLVAELFVDDLDRVVQALELDDDGVSLFNFFQAIISGDLLEVDPVAGSVLNLTMDHHHKYLSLMARLHPDMVYDYLSTHDNYRAEDCLKLCQEYGIADASAYLLERLGNVSSALQLILQTLESRLMNLKRTVRGMGLEVFRSRRVPFASHHAGTGVLSSLPNGYQASKDADGARRILTVALDLCQRNSGSLSSRSEHGSQLFFNVLDRLINAYVFLLVYPHR
jgi:vacuolar protein sorting-associated protein 8